MTKANGYRVELFPFPTKCDHNQEKRTSDTLRATEGIEDVSFEPSGIRISFNPQLLVSSYIAEILVNLGLERTEPRKKNFIARAIDNLAAKNQERFGNQPLECCNLNKKTTGYN